MRFSACSAVEYVNVVWEKVHSFVCKRTFCGAQDNALLLIPGLGLVQLVGTLPRRSLESHTVTANSRPRSKTRSAERIYIHIYIKDAPPIHLIEKA